MSSAVMESYSTPLGFIAIRPVSRSYSLTLPHVKVTSPYFGSMRFAFRTRSLSCLTSIDDISYHNIALEAVLGGILVDDNELDAHDACEVSYGLVSDIV